ncbi:hypothetical protein SDC9_168830 [bioreactor metagenome]|uniref:Uncharacterized protein n=1 Tax=bioreactor metagenome TaxID=1076179 RepID=A0A645G3K6_9ZZZZ
MGCAQIQLYPMQARNRLRSFAGISRQAVGYVRDAGKGDRTADCACRCQVYCWHHLNSNAVHFDFDIVIPPGHIAPVGVKSCITGVHGIKGKCLPEARFFIFTVRPHTQACAAVTVVIKNGHHTAGKGWIIRELYDHIPVDSAITKIMP